MDQKNENDSFEYTYSAPQNAEVQQIRQKYLPKEPDKMEQLRQLDQSVTRKGMACSLVVGVVGALILGIGMCCCMVWANRLFIPGIVIGCAGIACAAAAYPLYNRITAKERERIAPEILRLSEELLGGQA